jgi:hypothetical protein
MTTMAVTTGKRPRATLVKQDTVNQVSTFLTKLPEKVKEDLSLKEAVEQMQDSIKEVLSKGYSYADVAKMLSEKGVKISALTLKNYVPSGKRQAAKAKAARAPKAAAKTATKAVEPAPAPAKTARKTTTATKAKPAPAAKGRRKPTK